MPGYTLIYDSRRWVRSDSTDVTIVLPLAAGGTGNATGTATVNANLTGPITSTGNATAVASQTGTGSMFVMSSGPTITGQLTATGTIQISNAQQIRSMRAAGGAFNLIYSDASDNISIGDHTGTYASTFRVFAQASVTPSLSISTAGVASFAAPLKLKGYTVATLPAGAQGMFAYCTDLLLPAFLAVATGGGAVVGVVFYDGTNWVTV